MRLRKAADGKSLSAGGLNITGIQKIFGRQWTAGRPDLK